MKVKITILFLFPFLLTAQVKSPKDFLGYELGDKFTRHHRVVDYYDHVSSESSQVKLMEYGRTYEDRPLLLAFVSTVENIRNLDQIRQDNLRRTGIQDGSLTTNVAIVWLSYNVHGNESVSTEASMATIYELVKSGSDKADWLENTVIAIDPCINPDGRDRYVNFYWQYGNQPYNPDPNSLEHVEPWPKGRANHYLFDLNRDWAWQSQIESQQRIAVYNKWLPQIHVDFHEQGINAPYYFAPAAKPYHELITRWQRDFQVQIGKNHAKYFDKNNWFYFTKQFFDLLYPSYGDTYPTYNGAIGMTYEQGGSGRAGLGVIKQEGDTLTLKDRIAHHYTTGISTIEISSQNADRLLSEFQNFFGRTSNLKYKTFVLKYNGNDDKFNTLKKWLRVQGIGYGYASVSRALRGYNYVTGISDSFTINANDLVVNVNQPKSVLTHILFEPKTKLSDSVTYDITAWGIPYAYGIQAYATEQLVAVNDSKMAPFTANESPSTSYGFLAKWNSMDDARFLVALLKKEINVRFTEKTIDYQGQRFNPGSLIISKRDNIRLGNFERIVTDMANRYERSLTSLRTGFMDGGPDIGSAEVRYLKKPKIALLAGQGSSSLAFGTTWHFMEQDLGYPVTILRTDYFSRVDLSTYDVLIMQDGGYEDFGESEMKKIERWVSDGGKLIAVEGALNKFVDSDYSDLSTYSTDEEQDRMEKEEEKRDENAMLVDYDDQERDLIKGFVPGAVYRIRMDKSHPLAFGYGDIYFSLKTSSDRFGYLPSGNLGRIEQSGDLMSGFAGKYVRDDMAQSLVFGVENKGKGQIVHIVDNPLFRSFWQNGKLLFVNALFMVGQ